MKEAESSREEEEADGRASRTQHMELEERGGGQTELRRLHEERL